MHEQQKLEIMAVVVVIGGLGWWIMSTSDSSSDIKVNLLRSIIASYKIQENQFIRQKKTEYDNYERNFVSMLREKGKRTQDAIIDLETDLVTYQTHNLEAQRHRKDWYEKLGKSESTELDSIIRELQGLTNRARDMLNRIDAEKKVSMISQPGAQPGGTVALAPAFNAFARDPMDTDQTNTNFTIEAERALMLEESNKVQETAVRVVAQKDAIIDDHEKTMAILRGDLFLAQTNLTQSEESNRNSAMVHSTTMAKSQQNALAVNVAQNELAIRDSQLQYAMDRSNEKDSQLRGMHYLATQELNQKDREAKIAYDIAEGNLKLGREYQQRLTTSQSENSALKTLLARSEERSKSLKSKFPAPKRKRDESSTEVSRVSKVNKTVSRAGSMDQINSAYSGAGLAITQKSASAPLPLSLMGPGTISVKSDPSEMSGV